MIGAFLLGFIVGSMFSVMLLYFMEKWFTGFWDDMEETYPNKSEY